MHNADNERVKRRYLTYLKEAMRQSEASIDAVAKSLARFEDETNRRDFRTFRSEQAVAFKKRLAAKDSRIAFWLCRQGIRPGHEAPGRGTRRAKIDVGPSEANGSSAR